MNDRDRLYGSDFYGRLATDVARSAEVILPLVLDAVPVSSAVDVGCGDGTWLATLQRFGVEDILGIDGDHVAHSTLSIPPEQFLARDLEEPLRLDRRFDLAISLEVAEHLDPAAAKEFVRSLTLLAPAVLFSAAIPGQGGRHHVNEQWPSWWAERFRAEGHRPVDLVRFAVWEDERVLPWYAQNVLLFVAAERLPLLGLRELDGPLDLVHPRSWIKAQQAVPSLRDALTTMGGSARRLPPLLAEALRRRAAQRRRASS